ncbi:MAG: S-DNA-T family DNA segregation ATPase FtsK/SpoIIIE [Maribacter sp.]|jgi:S-DNA-T family DNA segregation ATPase FtsK/SpoIIIE
MAKKATKRKPTPTKKKTPLLLSKQNKIILGSLLALFSIALFFSFISFYFTWQEDQSMLTEFKNRNEQAKNLLNKFGASVSHFFVYKGFGISALIFPILLCLSGIYMFLGLDKKGLLKKWIWGFIFIIWISVTFGFFATESPLLGGLIGYEINDFLQDYAGKIGVLLLLVFGLVFITVRLFKLTPEGVASFFKSKQEALSSEFKSSRKTKSTTEDVLPLGLDEELVIIDTYTHKAEIPHLEKEPIANDFERVRCTRK